VVHCDMAFVEVRHIPLELMGSRPVAVVLAGPAEAAAYIAMWHLTWTWLYRKEERSRWSSSDCDPEEGLHRRYWRKQHLVVRSRRIQSSAANHDCIRDPAEPDIEPSRIFSQRQTRLARHPSSSRVAALNNVRSRSGSGRVRLLRFRMQVMKRACAGYSDAATIPSSSCRSSDFSQVCVVRWQC
jgi:hypothetical protein